MINDGKIHKSVLNSCKIQNQNYIAVKVMMIEQDVNINHGQCKIIISTNQRVGQMGS